MTLPCLSRLLQVSKLKNSSLPLLPVIQNSCAVGCITARPDKDGVYRRIPLLTKLADRCVPSLSLAALMAYWDLTPDCITLNHRKGMEIRHGAEIIRIPTDAGGMLLVNWGDIWKSFKRYSATDILSDSPDTSLAALYKDKIVIVAVTMTGSTDSGTTPLAVNAPLSRIHSHALSTIITRNFITAIPAFPWIMVISVACTLLFALSAARLSLKVAALGLALTCLVAVCVVALGFFVWSYEIPLIEAFLIFLPAASGLLFVRGVSMERHAAHAKRVAERYLPPEFFEQDFSRGISPDISTRRQEMTIVFLDMEGFSTLSETVDVEYVSRFLKEFFEKMSSTVLKYRGRIHQFLGDGFLAVFGDLIPLEDHAEAAVAAAMEMQKEMAELNAGWTNSGIEEFKKGIRIRIGINTGIVFAGDLGADRRLEYAIVGTTVNIASRLQSLAVPGGILMTARTRALLKNPTICQGPEHVKLKGFGREIEVYSIYMGIKE